MSEKKTRGRKPKSKNYFGVEQEEAVKRVPIFRNSCT